jgi:hypothetical protein
MLNNREKAAFGIPETDHSVYSKGFSKREYIATEILGGMALAKNSDLSIQFYAKLAVKYADALLEELAKDEK